MNHIVFFSGGKASFAVACYLKEKYPLDNIVLYFTDTLWEDGDLYRFIYECSDKLELPLLYHAHGLNPMQLMAKEKFMYNSRVGNCSRILKMKVSSDYLKKGIKPKIEKWCNKEYLKDDDFITDATVYFGIGFEEVHRKNAIVRNWQPFKVEMPLIDNLIDVDSYLVKYGIKQPRMYDLGFKHNNCKGRCVKAGKTHFKHLLEVDKILYEELMTFEILLSWYIRHSKNELHDQSKDYFYRDLVEWIDNGILSDRLNHMIMKDKYMRKAHLNGTSKPYSFLKNDCLKDIYDKPEQCSMFDWGGCGCFVDYEDEKTLS